MADISQVSRGTNPVKNNKVLSELKSIKMSEILKEGLGNPKLKEDFFLKYLKWLQDCSTSPVIGLEKFPQIYYVNGVTQSYDIFFWEHQGKRFRTVKGDYPYVKLAVNNWVYLEDDELQKNDALVLTCPFYENGDIPRNFEQILDQCLELRIPVMIDAAYFGTCYDTSFDYSHPAIEMVSFSLSKCLSLFAYRVGILFCKKSFSHLEELQKQTKYFNQAGAYIGARLMDKFPADFMPLNYKKFHQDVCQDLDLLPTKCIMLANVKNQDKRFDKLLEDNRFDQVILPDNAYRRVCISKYISDKDFLVKKLAKQMVQQVSSLLHR